ncbi:hypothetical protein [Arthrobacter sp.]|uniref:hypothetical protein n=1 Tax=Arthrobacter sp. TaxID=1667 RepID=UPI0026DF1AF3|nr:hypothetical protein [Arthrobacter sp.]MDO5751644.1 hypothetical protein [Arthrobacter sp.]
MTDSAAAQNPTRESKGKLPVWLWRTILGAIVAVVLVVGYLIASVTVPLMWANSIRDQVGGQLGNSIPLGMFYGFTFTFVPILIAWQAHHKKLNKWVRISLVSLGVLLTIPNLLTLGVLYGNTQTAADARSIWANSANWFGTWSQIFMVVGVVCAVALIVLGRMWMRRSKKLRELKTAEKLVRDSEAAKVRAAKDEARDAEKAAKVAARAARHNPPSNSSDSPEA